MSLFTTSQIITVNAVPYTYDSVGQVPGGSKNVVTAQYNRTGYEHLSSHMQVRYAYTASPTQKSVFRTTEMYANPITGVKSQVTFNTSVAHEKCVPLAYVQELMDRHEAAIALSGFRTAFLAKQP